MASQWLNIKGENNLIETYLYQWCWPSIIKKMPLKKYKKYTVFMLFVHLKIECEIIAI